MRIDLPNLEATKAFAEKLSRSCKGDEIFLLEGTLGAGKTTFAKFFIQSYYQDFNLNVTSPTFTLIQDYGPPNKPLWHSDLYRLDHAEEILNLGLDELYGRGIVLIEWPERMGPFCPLNAQKITFHLEDKTRFITLS